MVLTIIVGVISFIASVYFGYGVFKSMTNGFVIDVGSAVLFVGFALITVIVLTLGDMAYRLDKIGQEVARIRKRLSHKASDEYDEYDK